MEYKDFFSPATLEKLNKKSAENLKAMIGDKNLMQTMMSSQQLLSQIAKAETPYKQQLEKLAVNMVKELYPIIDQEGIVLDAKIGSIADVGSELDEIKVNTPRAFLPGEKVRYDKTIVRLSKNPDRYSKEENGKIHYLIDDPKTGQRFYTTDKYIKRLPIKENISPESRRRIINAITQGAALRGAFAFYLFKEHLDEIDPSLVEKYNQIMKNSFGIYDDENAIAMMLSLLAQGQKVAGGSSKVIIKEIKILNPGSFETLKRNLIKLIEWDKIHIFPNDEFQLEEADETIRDIKTAENEEDLKNAISYYASGDPWYYLNLASFKDKVNNPLLMKELNEAESGITIRARAINFPMLVHELIKGLYELISLQGFKGDKASNQAVVDKVDLLKNEPSDIRYGKFIFDALNDVFVNSNYDDPRIREFFFQEVYQLDDTDFISFIENAINDQLTPSQKRWAETILKSISLDLRDDDYDATGLDEIKVNKPSRKLPLFIEKGYDDQPYFQLKNGSFFGNYFEDMVEFQDVGEEYDELLQYLKNNHISYTESGEFLFVKKDDINLQKNIDEIKITKPFTESFLESFNKSFKDFISTQPLPKNLHPLLEEYSEKTITTTIERWKKDNPKVDDNIAKQIIQRFDQIKSGLSQKLDIIVLPDELKKGQNYLNIDKYSYDDMINLIRSIPENPDKIKKDAVNKFVEKEQIDKQGAQSYVARFMANRDKLKLAVQKGLEDEGFTKEEVLKFIPKKLQQRDSFLDPRNWDWKSFEQMLDAIFPSQKTATEEEENLVSTDADKIFSKNGIEIYKGDDLQKCISYNPISSETKRKKYGWCVTQVGNTNYDYYRFGDKAPTFYFVFDRNKPSTPEYAPFEDEWHAFIIQVTADNKEYIITGANNRGDIPTKDKGWEGIKDIVPADTWNKIKGLKDYFKPIALSSVERGRKFASGKNLSLSEFKELSQDEKIQYILGKASKNQLTTEILKILPQYKIPYEGRSTTLMNIAIDGGQDIPYSILSKYEPLAKRYAIFRSRHNVLGQKPIPLPFVKYLDEKAKEKYLETFDDNLTFEYIDKFFGPTSAEKYVTEQAKKLDYLPKEAFKYIKDPNLKKIYDIYSKLFDSWQFNSNTNIDEETLSNLSVMPEQEISPIPMNQTQWNKLSSTEKELIIKLAEKYNKNINYTTLLYALPFIIEDNNKKYILLPKSNNDFDYSSWVLIDEQGKTIKDNIPGDATLGGQPLTLGYPDEDSSYNRIYNIKDLKTN
jgi:hypothetical protein